MAKVALLTLALLLAACGTGSRGVEIVETPAPPPRNCPIIERSGSDTSEDGRVFEVVFGGFVSAVFSYTDTRQLGQFDQMRNMERNARSHLTPAYNARLGRLEDVLMPFHNGEGARSFTIDYLKTRFERNTATQEIAYCFAGGGVWTQVFHLRRIDGVWQVDSIEPARRRQA